MWSGWPAVRWSHEQILRNHPQLAEEDILAALRYAAEILKVERIYAVSHHEEGSPANFPPTNSEVLHFRVASELNAESIRLFRPKGQKGQDPLMRGPDQVQSRLTFLTQWVKS